jgi:uroporphyrin-III C-methyltransferase
MSNAMGHVSLVGAGPGDPELLTLKAARRLREADVVLYDQLVDKSILDLCKSAVRVFVGKVPDGPSTPQGQINELLYAYASKGLRVVRLKGGDSFVFGRGGEEAIYLAERGATFDIVPGISSSISVPESALIPVTHRGVSTHFTVITGMSADEDLPIEETWSALAKTGGTLVFLMGVRALDRISAALIAGGADSETPVAVIEKGTTAEERVVVGTLATIHQQVRDERIQSPATIVVGEVVRLRGQMTAGLVREFSSAQNLSAVGA